MICGSGREARSRKSFVAIQYRGIYLFSTLAMKLRVSSEEQLKIKLDEAIENQDFIAAAKYRDALLHNNKFTQQISGTLAVPTEIFFELFNNSEFNEEDYQVVMSELALIAVMAPEHQGRAINELYNKIIKNGLTEDDL